MLILSESLQKDLKHEAKERGKAFVKDNIEEIAKQYHDRLPELNEFWIFIAAKRDKISGKLNAYIKAVDRDHLYMVNVPIQGAQLWYINWKTGQKKLEWILPLQPRKSKMDVQVYTKDNLILQKSLYNANKFLGRNLVTGE